MLAWESVVEAKALRARGWSISAIARHLQINRRTVRRYLSDEAAGGCPGLRGTWGGGLSPDAWRLVGLRVNGEEHLEEGKGPP
jgi:hypothetical protein